jgi:uncharacterized protein (DUF433 family)
VLTTVGEEFSMASLARPLPHVEITCDREIMGGMPCIAGTRVPAETILACINGGDSRARIYRAYPYLPLGAYEAVVAWAAHEGRPCCAS